MQPLVVRELPDQLSSGGSEGGNSTKPMVGIPLLFPPRPYQVGNLSELSIEIPRPHSRPQGQQRPTVKLAGDEREGLGGDRVLQGPAMGRER